MDQLNLLEKTLGNIEELDKDVMEAARERMNALIKPAFSLGRLEDLAVQLAGITRNLYPDVSKKAIIAMAGDHGVYDEGVSGNPQGVTFAQAGFFAKGLVGVSAIGRVSGAEVVTVDIGVIGDFPSDSGVIPRKIKHGTDNIAKGSAMTRDEAIQSIEVGIEIAQGEINKGVQILGTGEMGIGNTTPSTAIVSLIGDIDPLEVTGKGAGLGSGGIEHKAEVIRKAIRVNKPNPKDGIDILSKIGGLEIGGMAGVMIAGAAHRIPVVVDGFISTAAALIAVTIEPKVKDYLIAAHTSAEKGAKKASELLGIEPLIELNMCLGEGSGAALVLPIIESACSAMKHMATFEEVGMTL